MRSLWVERYDACNSDELLMQLAILIRRNGARGAADWFRRHLGSVLSSEVPFTRAKAIGLQGFMEQDELAFGPESDSDDDVAWIDEVRFTAKRRVRAETFARYWFRQFCCVDDLVRAWAAYRLFRLSADRRCLLWCALDMQELNAGPRKQAFFATTFQRLHRTLRENEKKLGESFLNCKVDGSLAPVDGFRAMSMAIRRRPRAPGQALVLSFLRAQFN